MPFYFSQIAKRAVPFLFLAACWAQTSDPPRITSSTFITVAQATSVSIPLNANGGTPPYIYSLQSGTLPTGLFLTQSGVIIGAVMLVGGIGAQINNIYSY